MVFPDHTYLLFMVREDLRPRRNDNHTLERDFTVKSFFVLIHAGNYLNHFRHVLCLFIIKLLSIQTWQRHVISCEMDTKKDKLVILKKTCL